MLEELQHRIANSLQIIASIILMKARAVQSEETRFHLEDAHKRVLSIAAAETAARLGGSRSHRNCTLSLTVVREPCDLDDWWQPADLAESGW